jgi:drug/metabolite transporter (DMT)-like permease
MSAWAWVVFTVLASGGQVMRNALQRELTTTLGTVGATHVRFLYGLPFGLLFLALVLTFTGTPLPHLNQTMIGWTLVGALSQICATALLLAAMREKNFVVVTALSKTEPLYVALFGLVVLGDQLTAGLVIAILIATAGVLVMSWPKAVGPKTVEPKAVASKPIATEPVSWRPILLGLISASAFALSAIGFRRGILSLTEGNFAVRASTTLALGLTIQTVLLSSYLLATSRDTFIALLKAWRPSVKAGFMGAFASQMWFLAFALETAAKVRTLALIEILFAGLISRSLFKQGLVARDGLGIALIILGVALLLNQ